MIYALIAALVLVVIVLICLIVLYLDMRSEYNEMHKLNEHYLDIYTGYRGALEKELGSIREIRKHTMDILDKCIKITSEEHDITKEILNSVTTLGANLNGHLNKIEDRYSQLYDQYKDLKLEMKSRAHDILAAMPDNFNVPDEETFNDRLQYDPPKEERE